MKNKAHFRAYTAVFRAKKRRIGRNILHKGAHHFIILPIDRRQNGKMGTHALS
jgi:hypothetical protein